MNKKQIMNEYDLDESDYKALVVQPATLSSALAEVNRIHENLSECCLKDKLIPEIVALEMLITRLKPALKHEKL
jgi:hypothetical protein